jgi:hypothetical protein
MVDWASTDTLPLYALSAPITVPAATPEPSSPVRLGSAPLGLDVVYLRRCRAKALTTANTTA